MLPNNLIEDFKSDGLVTDILQRLNRLEKNNRNLNSTSAPVQSSIAAYVAATIVQVVPNSATEIFDFNSEIKDTDNFWAAGSPTLFTIPYDGYYLIGAWITYGINSVGIRQTDIVAGGVVFSRDSRPGLTGVNTGVTLTCFKYLTAGQTARVQGWQNSGGDLNTVPSLYFWIAKI